MTFSSASKTGSANAVIARVLFSGAVSFDFEQKTDCMVMAELAMMEMYPRLYKGYCNKLATALQLNVISTAQDFTKLLHASPKVRSQVMASMLENI